MNPRTARRRGPIAVGAVVVLLALTAGCGGSAFSSGQQGFVSGDGSVTVVPQADRRPPDEVSGTTLEGAHTDLADLRGKVVVVPVWGSWCGPCRAEAPMLTAAADDLRDDGVAFLGINSRDASVDNAKAFVRTFGVGYPSIYDPTGSLLLAFHAGVTPNSIPSVVFLDAEGRVAAAVLGEITRTTLYDVVEEIT